jgi:PAS domain S-box-containing protein
MDKITALRQQLESNVGITASVLDGMSADEISLLVHELWTRQNELEAENEDVRQTCLRLETLQRHYSDLYDFAPMSYAVLDHAGVIRDANHTLAWQLGVERNLLLNTRFDLYVLEQDHEIFAQHLKKLFAANLRAVCRLTLRTTRGAHLPVHLESIVRHTDDGGSQCRTMIVDMSDLRRQEDKLRELRSRLEGLVREHSRQLTEAAQQLRQETVERERVGQALQASEQQYRLLAEHVSDGIAILRDGGIIFANRAFGAVFGRDADRLMGRNPAALFVPEAQASFETLVRQVRPDFSLQRFRVACTTENGREIWVEGDVGQLDWEGRPAILMTARDVTAQKIHETALEEERSRLSKELRTLKSSVKNRYRFSDIIGKSAPMQQVYDQITRAAATDANVFVYGESGTGKELVARTIHKMSKRRDHRFVPVNCGAIPDALFESEFFGHRKGAFTGAFRDKEGFFSAAHNGTLFLDELGELPPAMQVKLLRVLDDGDYTRVGDTTPRKADVRIIAATNRNLEDMRKRGLIREDFFFRIHVFAMTLPPIRERREDIPLLLSHFLEHYSHDTPPPILPGSVLEMLYAYDWPGNVREFQNVIQRYLNGQPLTLLDSEQPPAPATAAIAPSPRQTDGQEFHEVMDEFEKKLILGVLEQHRWNKSKTAAVLGIPRRTLYRKMARYGIG